VFLASDLPTDPKYRDEVLLTALGSPHPRQIDGIGGGHSLSSKVAIVGPSTVGDADVDYLFAQVSVDTAIVDTAPSCGNMMAAVGPFAIESGLVSAADGETIVRIHNVNTGSIAHATVCTPGGSVTYMGEQTVDGVPGSAAPIRISMQNAEGSVTGSLIPTTKTREEIGGVPVTLIDYAMPLMVVEANTLGLSGAETPETINEQRLILQQIERMRIEAGKRMGLGNVRDSVVPKVSIISPPRNGGSITSRYLTPHSCHPAHAVLGAMCLAIAARIDGTIAAGVVDRFSTERGLRIEHPGGNLDIEVTTAPAGDGLTASVVRTARKLFEGRVFVPSMLFQHSS
jgi:hypothetical protein